MPLGQMIFDLISRRIGPYSELVWPRGSKTRSRRWRFR